MAVLPPEQRPVFHPQGPRVSPATCLTSPGLWLFIKGCFYLPRRLVFGIFSNPWSVFTKQWFSNLGRYPNHLQGLHRPSWPVWTHPQDSELIGLGQSLRTCISSRLSVLAQAPHLENHGLSDDLCNVLTTPPSLEPALSTCWVCGVCLLM